MILNVYNLYNKIIVSLWFELAWSRKSFINHGYPNQTLIDPGSLLNFPLLITVSTTWDTALSSFCAVSK